MFAFRTISPDGQRAYRVPDALLTPLGRHGQLVRVVCPGRPAYAVSRSAAASMLRAARRGARPVGAQIRPLMEARP